MKKTIVSKLLLLIVIFSIISCGKTSVDETEEADIATSASLASSDETQSPYYDTYICGLPDVEPYVETEYSEFDGYEVVMVEWGDAITIKDSEGEVLDLTADDGISYVCFAVKFVKLFESTFKERGIGESILSGEIHTGLFVELNLETYAEISDGYDEIMLIPAQDAHLIEKGNMNIIFAYDAVYIPYLHLEKGFFVNGQPSYNEYVWALTPAPVYTYALHGEYLESGSKTPFLISVVDGKIVIDNKSSYIKTENGKDYISSQGERFIIANDRLIHLGLDDNLFREGMTVEELEKYFNLVTKTETFAPLFED